MAERDLIPLNFLIQKHPVTSQNSIIIPKGKHERMKEMEIKFNSLKCPECGAFLEIENGRNQAFCSYCGAKILVTNENEHIYRHIDEAGVKQAETDRIVRLKQMDIAEKKRASDEKTKVIKIKTSLIMATIGILMMVIGYLAGSASGNPDSGLYMISLVGFFPLMGAAYIWLFSKIKDEDDDCDGKVKVPSTISDYEGKSYTAIEAIFTSAGFTNIRSVPLNDLRTGLLKKPGMVESITINGKAVSSVGRNFLPDATVVISYHSFAGR